MLSPSVLAWIGIATTLLVTIGQWVDPANVQTPWNWSPKARIALFTVLSAAVAFAKSFTDAPGTPWLQTLFVAGPTLLAALAAHFAHAGVEPKPVALGVQRGYASLRALATIVFVFAVGSVACGLFAPAAIPALGACELSILSAKPPLAVFLARSVVECGANWLALFGRIAEGKDPALAEYVDEARAAQSDTAKMQMLKSKVESHVSAMRAGL